MQVIPSDAPLDARTTVPDSWLDARSLVFDAGAILALQGDVHPALVLEKGTVDHVFVSRRGRELILACHHPGEMVGLASALLEAPGTGSLVAGSEGAVVRRVSGRVLDQWRRQPAMLQLARQAIQAERLAGASVMSVAERLRWLGGGLDAVSKARLAAMLGCTREALSRTISRLGREKHGGSRA